MQTVLCLPLNCHISYVCVCLCANKFKQLLWLNSTQMMLFYLFFAVHQGFVMNLQPSEAEAGFDIRVPPTADAESLERRIAEEWAPAWRNMSVSVSS